MPEFGTSGLRGLATELTDALCARYAEAFLSGTKHNGSVLIGRDLRDSSPRLRDAVASGAARLGVSVIDCGILPTPALALATQTYGTAAIMITGSHIPADRNGLKFYNADGEITKDDEARITAKFAELPDHVTGPADDIVTDAEPLKAFTRRYTEFFGPDALRKLRVGVYQHSSVARDLMVALIEGLGAVAVPLARSESFVPVDTEAVDHETRAMLASWAQTHGLDAIISTDGDADRPMVANAAGDIVPGDVLGPLTAQFLGATAIATPVSSNSVLEMMQRFNPIARCRIGSPYVIAAMEELRSAGETAIVGYEANGGFLLGYEVNRNGRTLAPLATRDFALPILSCLALMTETGQSLAELRAALPPRFTASNRLQDIPKNISQIMVERALKEDDALLPNGCGAIAHVDQTDGARMTLEDGTVFHIRPSGNAPELRCYIEADSADKAADILDGSLSRLKAVSADVS